MKADKLISNENGLGAVVSISRHDRVFPLQD